MIDGKTGKATKKEKINMEIQKRGKKEERLTKERGQRYQHSLYKHCKKENDGWKDRESNKEDKGKKKYGNTDEVKKEKERLTKGSGQWSPHSLYKHCWRRQLQFTLAGDFFFPTALVKLSSAF
jgi:hypothetical protein